MFRDSKQEGYISTLQSFRKTRIKLITSTKLELRDFEKDHALIIQEGYND